MIIDIIYAYVIILDIITFFPYFQVFEILLHFAEHSNWKEAFYHVIPKRKGLTSYQNSLSNASEDECGSEKSVEVNCLDSPHVAKQDETKQEDTRGSKVSW